MVSGKCPHPWNENKKGNFQEGHKQVNQGRGCFIKGRKLQESQKELNKKIQKNRYTDQNHPFCKINKLRERHTRTGTKRTEWLIIRNLIIEKDLFKCRGCGKTHHETILNVHHKDCNPKNNYSENLITLCVSCHAKIHMNLLEVNYVKNRQFT